MDDEFNLHKEVVLSAGQVDGHSNEFGELMIH